ncbi:hypothetical protein NFI96_006520 [Prochilodus magdalenae]|nr:hypothetical protein NFI96_006520 [Prochilodus magdalenae]
MLKLHGMDYHRTPLGTSTAPYREVWIQERLSFASSKEYGTSLQSVQQLVKSHEALQMEVQARRPRLEEVLERAEAVAALRTPEVELVREGAVHVRQLWEVLQVEIERRTVMLDAVSHAQQYYTEAAKAESWLSGQKLHVLNEENGNDEASTLRLLKEQLALEQKVENYAETVGFLSQQCRRMLELGHPDSEQITKQQAHIDRLYVSLKDLVEQRKTKLEQQYWLYQLKREVEALEKWISEREAVASSTELGQNLEHVTLFFVVMSVGSGADLDAFPLQALQEKFTEFRAETSSVGQRQMDSVNKMVNEMIDCGHADAATIAEWKDGLNESWADLQELMETRAQMLAASHQLHKFLTDCQEVLVQIEGKMRQLPEVRSCQVSTANPGTLQRLLHSFEHSLQLLVAQSFISGHRRLATRHCTRDAIHGTLPHRTLTYRTLLHRTLSMGCCPQDAAHRRLPTGRCSTGRCPHETAHRTLLHRTLLHRTLSTGCYPRCAGQLCWIVLVGGRFSVQQ